MTNLRRNSKQNLLLFRSEFQVIFLALVLFKEMILSVTFFAAISDDNLGSVVKKVMKDSMKNFDERQKDHGITKGWQLSCMKTKFVCQIVLSTKILVAALQTGGLSKNLLSNSMIFSVLSLLNVNWLSLTIVGHL